MLEMRERAGARPTLLQGTPQRLYANMEFKKHEASARAPRTGGEALSQAASSLRAKLGFCRPLLAEQFPHGLGFLMEMG
jgi:hypothetical protein